MDTSTPTISIVVATRNRLPLLKACVDSIRAQRYPKEQTELVIVNDGSTDETPKYLSQLALSESWVKVISQVHQWQSSARNKGIAASSGQLIAITDDDCTVAPDWLSSIAQSMDDTGMDAIGGHIHAPGASLVAQFLDYVRALDPALLPDGRPRHVVTANVCFRRNTLEQIGLFDEMWLQLL